MKEGLESIVENGERREAEWRSLVEPTKQEKLSRFSRIGRKIEDIVRFLSGRKEKLAEAQMGDNTVDGDNMQSVKKVTTDEGVGTADYGNTPEEIKGAKSFNDIIDFNELNDDDYVSLNYFDKKQSSPSDFEKAERAQELYERGINDAFTPMYELEAIFDNGAEQSSKQSLEYEGKNITVYNTGNVELYYLQHDLYFQGRSRLVDDPSLWDLDESDARAKGLWSNLLSMQLLNSNDSRSPNGVSYGFLHVPPNSINAVGGGGFPLQNRKRRLPEVGSYNHFPKKEELPTEVVSHSGSHFVETQAFRYDEKGKTIFHPDFIIAPSEGLDEETLRQAAYFDVPVFIIPNGKVETDE